MKEELLAYLPMVAKIPLCREKLKGVGAFADLFRFGKLL
jgi:hypothetical protein